MTHVLTSSQFHHTMSHRNHVRTHPLTHMLYMYTDICPSLSWPTSWRCVILPHMVYIHTYVHDTLHWSIHRQLICHDRYVYWTPCTHIYVSYLKSWHTHIYKWLTWCHIVRTYLLTTVISCSCILISLSWHGSWRPCHAMCPDIVVYIHCQDIHPNIPTLWYTYVHIYTCHDSPPDTIGHLNMVCHCYVRTNVMTHIHTSHTPHIPS